MSTMSESPLTYLPHRPPMVFVDAIESVDEDAKTCECSWKIPEDFFLLEDGAIPEVVLIESMAQASACLKGWIDVRRGLPVKTGYLVAVNVSNFHEPPAAGDALSVHTEMIEEVSNYFQFKCAIKRSGDVVADAVLGFMVAA